MKQPPKVRGLPLIGDSWSFIRDPIAYHDRTAQIYGPVFQSKVLGVSVYSLLGANCNRAVLQNSQDNFSCREGYLPFLKQFGLSLLLMDGEQHRNHRSLIHQSFTRDALDKYLHEMNAGVDGALRSLRAGVSLKFHDFAKSVNLNIAVRLLTGVNLGTETEVAKMAFTDAIESAGALIRISLPGSAYRRGEKARLYLRGRLLHQMSADRNMSAAQDLLSRMLYGSRQSGTNMPEAAIVDHINAILNGAHGTTSSVLSSLVYLLGANHEWQARVRSEIKAYGDAYPGFKDISSMVSLDAAYREALRMYPPSIVILRKSKQACAIEGFNIPGNSFICLAPRYTHFMSDFWEHPQDFSPDRFLPPRSEHKSHSHCWIPFGGGDHYCIGMHYAALQTKVFIVHLLRRFTVGLLPNYRYRIKYAGVLAPADGLPITLGEHRVQA